MSTEDREMGGSAEKKIERGEGGDKRRWGLKRRGSKENRKRRRYNGIGKRQIKD